MNDIPATFEPVFDNSFTRRNNRCCEQRNTRESLVHKKFFFVIIIVESVVPHAFDCMGLVGDAGHLSNGYVHTIVTLFMMNGWVLLAIYLKNYHFLF